VSSRWTTARSSGFSVRTVQADHIVRTLGTLIERHGLSPQWRDPTQPRRAVADPPTHLDHAESPGSTSASTVTENLEYFAGLLWAAPSDPGSKRLSTPSTWAIGRRSLGGLSKGLRQRVGLHGHWLSDPAIMFLDEPTRASTRSPALEVHNLLIASGNGE